MEEISQEPQQIVDNKQFAMIPTIELTISKLIGDGSFEKENIVIKVSSWSIEEAKDAFMFVIENHKSIK